MNIEELILYYNEKPMKNVFISNQAEYGGGNKYIGQLKECLKGFSPAYRIFLCDGYGWRRSWWYRLTTSAKVIAVVHTTHMGMQLKRRYRWYEKLLAKWYDRFWASGCHSVIVSNQFNADILTKEGVNPLKIHVVYNYPDPPNVTISGSNIRVKHNIPADRIIIGTVARLSGAKDWKTVFKTMRRTIQRRQNVHFLIVGDGALYERLDLTVREMDIASHVTFAGFQENVWNYYLAMDIFVLCSFGEGVPNVILEAMTMMLPIVSTNSGAVSEAISEYIVPIGDFYGIEKSILKIIKSNIIACKYDMTKFTKESMISSLREAL